MNEDLKSKVIDVIDSLIPKGQNSLGLREADMVYGINKAKEAVEKLFAEISTQDCISRQPVLDAIDEIESEVADGDGFQYEKWKQYFCDLPSADIDLSDYSDRLWRKAYEQGKADAESDRVSPGNIVINEQGRLKYCPVCGSRMKGEDDDTD